MKKFASFIIILITFFSSVGVKAYDEGTFDEIMNFDNGPMIYDLSLEKLDNYNFKDAGVKRSYESLKKLDSIARGKLMQSYENGDYDFYTMNGIITNYKTFIYNSNKFFYFLNIVDKTPALKDDREIQYYISSYYKASRSSYTKVVNLLNSDYE